MARTTDTSPVVRFYQLAATSMAEAVARLANKAYDRGLKSCLLVRDAAHAREMDDYLWLFPADSFLPHGVSSGKNPAGQPLLIATAPDDRNGATVILITAETVVSPEQFDMIIDFVVTANLNASRIRFSHYQKAGCQMEYWEQTDQGWKKK